MAGNSADGFASRESLSLRDMREILGKKPACEDEDVVLEDFVSFCKDKAPKFPNAKALRLTCRRLTDRGLHALVAFLGGGYVSSLRQLSIVTGIDVGPQVAGEGFCEIFQSGSLNDLTSLELECWSTKGIQPVENSVYEAFVQALLSGHLTKLQSLIFLQFHKKVESFGLVELHGSFGSLFENLAIAFASSRLGSVLELDLFIGRAAKEGLISLFKSIPRSLKVLRLFGRDSFDAAEPLAEALASCPLDSLREVHLRNSSPTENTIVCLAKAFQSGHARKLELLDLSWNSNKIGDTDAEALAKAFGSGNLTSLGVLHLQGNNIGIKGVTDVFQSFQSGKCPKLDNLDLSVNDFKVDNNLLLALAKALESGNLSKLRNADLRNATTPTRAAGMKEIARVLGACSLPNLQTLLLFSIGDEMDDLPTDVKDDLVNSYRRNPSLMARMWPGYEDSGTSVGRKLAALQLRNRERLGKMKLLQDEDDVPGEYGKVFLCGSPRVGKTTLRKTLTKHKPQQGTTLCFWKSGQETREPTRGIETANIQSKGTTLALWDLAGQPEYEVLHSAFLPDLNFVDGQATCFVIVCKANDTMARAQLCYWLKFISSNSVEGISKDKKPRAFVILNCFYGKRDGARHVEDWIHFLTICQDDFGKFLNLQKDPWIMDVTCETEVRALRKKLLEEAQVMQSRKMPQICRTVQEHGMRWAKGNQRNQRYPVLPWNAYCQVVGPNCSDQKLAAAAEYLHDVGLIILFRRLDSTLAPDLEGAASTSQTTQRSLVIVDPQWFGQKVVGKLLLPELMRQQGEDYLMPFQGKEGVSLPISFLKKKMLNVPSDKVDEAIGLLSHFGICYRLQDRADVIFVPDLITKTDLPGWSYATWEGNAGAWVMGFSLKVKNEKEAFLPIATLRHLQVDLALDKDVGSKPDSDYLATRSAISFKYQGMFVLIEYALNKQDRIDVLVRPLVHQVLDTSARAKQVQVAQEFVTRIKHIVQCRCRSVELQKQIIKPWVVDEGPKSIDTRDIRVSAEEVKKQVKRTGELQTMDWTMGSEQVEQRDVLSDYDLLNYALREDYQYKEIQGSLWRGDVELLSRNDVGEDNCGMRTEHVTMVSTLREGIEGKEILSKETCPQAIFKECKHGEAEEEERRKEEDKEQSSLLTSVYEELQLRPDIRSAGFSSWDQGFNPGQILALCNVTTSKEEVHFIFFHVEGMARLFGIGVPHSKISIFLDNEEVVVEEMTENSWKAFWSCSYEGAFKPMLFEKTVDQTEALSQDLEENVLHMTKDEALSKLGLSVDGPLVQEFFKMSEPTPQDRDSRRKFLPRWMSLVKSVIDVVFPPVESRQQWPDRPGQESMDQVPGGTKPGVAEKTDESKQRGSLVIEVIFHPVCYQFYRPGSGDQGQLHMMEGCSHLAKLSCISPKLMVEFFQESGENCLNTTLEGKYGMAFQEGIAFPAGWYQNDLILSFQCSEDEVEKSVLVDTRIKSEVSFVDEESTLQSGESRSTQREMSSQGGFQGAIVNVQASGHHGETSQASESNQRRLRSKGRAILADYPLFGINDHSMNVNGSMEFRASYPDRTNVEGLGSQSKVEMTVEGSWVVVGEGTHTYEFKAKKRLSRQASTTNVPGVSSHVASWVNDVNSTCISDTGHDNRNVVKTKETLETVLQTFSRKFLLNHNFSQFFETYSRPFPYKWKLLDQGNQGNPVPVAFKVSS